MLALEFGMLGGEKQRAQLTLLCALPIHAPRWQSTSALLPELALQPDAVEAFCMAL
jgi:hypothetical protein